MECPPKVKGTVTSLSSVYPAEDAKKAAKRVQDTIAEKHQQLDQLRDFAADNTSLVNLVTRLPEHLHHDVMVPFGKAAFFSGRLVHTNEFLVLLGEGYYTERTAKQTVDILMRRGKALDSQLDSLNAVLNDLRLEASFLDTTASEAAEGLVEIREEYVEETSSERESEAGPLKQDSSGSSGAGITKDADEDEEFARIASRLDELEKEELEAENAIVSEEEQTKDELGAQSDNESDEDEQVKADLHQFSDHKSIHQLVKISEESISRKAPEQIKDEIAAIKESFTDDLSSSGLTVQPVAMDKSSHGNILDSDVKSSSEKALVPPEVENVQAMHLSRSQVPLQSCNQESDGPKDVIGSIVERSHNVGTNSREQTIATPQSYGSQPSKPVSRFRMSRR